MTATPNAGLERLVGLSKVLAHDYVAWVEGRMSQTQFVVDMAQHLVDLKEMVESNAATPQPGAEGDARDAQRLDWVISNRNYRVQGSDQNGWFVLDCTNGLTFLTDDKQPTYRDAIDAGIAALASRRELGGVALK